MMKIQINQNKQYILRPLSHHFLRDSFLLLNKNKLVVMELVNEPIE